MGGHGPVAQVAIERCHGVVGASAIVTTLVALVVGPRDTSMQSDFHYHISKAGIWTGDFGLRWQKEQRSACMPLQQLRIK